MSFISAAVAIGLEGAAATIGAGAMMGGAMTIGGNLVRGNNPFDNIGQGILMGGVTAGIAPWVGETLGVGSAAATGLTAGALGYAKTGDISKGLTAGLGAYGLSSLGGNLESAGGESLANADTALNAQRIGEAAGETAVNSGFPEAAAQDIDTAGNAVPRTSVTELKAQMERDGFTPEEIRAKLSEAGRSAVGSDLKSAGSFLKANAKNLMYAAAPIFADQAVQSKMPQIATKPGMIRPYSYDPYSGRYTAYDPYEATPTKAADGGLMGYGESSNAPITQRNIDNMQNTGGMFNYAQDGGGVMRMAGGGLAALAFADGGTTMVSPYQNAIEHPETIPLQYGETQEQGLARLQGWQTDLDERNKRRIEATGAQAPETINYTQSPAGLNAANPTVQTEADLKYWTDRVNAGNAIKPGLGGDLAATQATIRSLMANNPAPVGPTNAQMMAAQEKERAELDARRKAMLDLYGPNAGVSTGPGGVATVSDFNTGKWKTVGNSEQQVQALANKMPDVPAVGGPPMDRASAMGVQTLSKPDTAASAAATGIQTVHGNIYDPVTGHFRNPTEAEIGAKGIREARDDINKVGEMTALTKEYFNSYKPGEVLDFAGGTLTKNADGTATHTYTDSSGKTKSYTFNKDTDIATIAKSDPAIAAEWKSMFDYTAPSGGGTGVTIRPNIPGMPPGGFTGMTEVRNAYTQGGGSLGYTPYVPTSYADFLEKYNKQTGGSKQSYDYLSGAAEYSPTPYTPTGEIMKPYSESVLGMPEDITLKKYLFNPKTQKYDLNPAYIPPQPLKTPAEGKEWTWDGTKKKWAETDPVEDSNTDPNTPPTASAGDGYHWVWNPTAKKWIKGEDTSIANGGLAALAGGGMAGRYNLGGYSDGGRLLRGPGDGVSDSIPATIGHKQPARLADGEFVVPARIVSELGNGSTEAGARKLYAMMDRVQSARQRSIGKGNVAKNSRADKYLPV